MSARRFGVGAVAVLCVSLALLVLGGSAALADKQYVPGPGSLFAGGEGSGDGQFIEPVGIAVNDSSDPTVGGDVYVVDKGNNRVERFSAAGAYLSQFNGSGLLPGEGKAAGSGAGEEPTGQLSEPEAIAVDNSGKSVVEDPSVGDVYVADPGHKVIDKFSATGEYKGQLTGTCPSGVCAGEEAFERVSAIAVDPSGNLWVAGQFERVSEFSDTGSLTRTFSIGVYAPPSLAVDAAGNAYVVSLQEKVLEFESATDVLLREFGPGSSAIALDPTTGSLLVDKGSSLDLYAPSSEANPSPEYTFAEEGLTGSAGLAVNPSGTTYASERGVDEVEFFTAVLVPGTGAESASQLGEAAEKLTGSVNPEGETVTACSFEYALYGTPAGVYPQSVPCQQAPTEIGSGNKAVVVSAEVSGLRPGSTYHFRLKASNPHGSAHGRDETFIVEQSLVAPLALPDNRAYELVSTIDGTEVFPPAAGQPISNEVEEYGELIANVGGYRAASDGEAVAYMGGLSPSGTGGYGVGKNYDGNLYLSERGPAGWRSSDIDPVASNQLIEGFSADLSQQIINIGDPSFNKEHGGPPSCETQTGGIYSRGSGVGAPNYTLLTTTTTAGEECEFLTFAGVSADDAHALVQSPGAYTPNAIKGEEGSSERGSPLTGSWGFDNLYDHVSGGLYQVNILPDGQAESTPHAIFGGRTRLEGRLFEHNFEDDISANGERIFWTSLTTGDLYVRENDTQLQSPIGPNGECTVDADACTTQIDAGEAQCVAEDKCKGGGGVFWAASSDGSKVFFTDCNRLTVSSTAVAEENCEREVSEEMVPTGQDLYEYDVASGRLTDLTVDGNATDTLGADVLGVIGASEDGSYVYFVADGVLAGENAEGGKPIAGLPNLYVSRKGRTTYITTLEVNDNKFSGTSYLGTGGREFADEAGKLGGDWRAKPGLRTAQVSVNGGVVAFMSRRPVTGYDNYGLVSVNEKKELSYGAQPEIYIYTIAGGRVACVSCRPTGSPPSPTAEGWENEVGGHVGLSGNDTFRSRWMNVAGTQIFFDSAQPLVSRDTNHRQDVYEWESEGSDGCTRSVGCVNLISGGDVAHDAYFLDASETGGNVFFTTREQLLQGAVGESVKLYDARVDGGVPEYPLACTGTGCQGVPPAQPIFATPSSVTFGGVGNFVAPGHTAKPKAKKKTKSATCRKGAVRKNGKCVRKHKPARRTTKKSSAKGRK